MVNGDSLKTTGINCRHAFRCVLLVITVCYFLEFLSIASLADATGINSDGVKIKNEAKMSIEEALTFAVDHNKDLKIFNQKIREQIGVALQFKAKDYPSFSIVTNYDQVDANLVQSNNGLSNTKSWQAGLRMDYLLYDAGAIRKQQVVQDYQIQALKEQYRALVNSLIFNVKKGFIGVLLAKEKIIVQQKLVELLAEELRQEKQRYSAGTVSQFNVITADVALANSKTPLIMAQNEERLAREQLRGMLGYSLQCDGIRSEEGEGEHYTTDIGFDIRGELKYQPIVVQLDRLMRDALERRPELKALSLQIEAEKEGVEFALLNNWPALSMYGFYGLEKDRASNDLLKSDNGWRLGAQVQWKIFDGFETSSKVESAEARLQQAEESLEQSKLNIEVEVRRVYSSFTEATELVQASTKVVEQGEESVRLAKSRLGAGVGTQLELLNAQYALTLARTNHIQALYNYAGVVADIDRVVSSL